MLSHVSGSGGPDDGCIAFLLISGPMSTTTSFRTASGRLAAKYIPLRPPMDSPTSTSGARPRLVHHARNVAERGDRTVDVRRIAIAVATLVERPDVEVRLERDRERVPRVGVPREAVEQQQMRAALAAPVEDAQLETVDGDVALVRPQEVHEAKIPPGRRARGVWQKEPPDAGGRVW